MYCGYSLLILTKPLTVKRFDSEKCKAYIQVADQNMSYMFEHGLLELITTMAKTTEKIARKVPTSKRAAFMKTDVETLETLIPNIMGNVVRWAKANQKESSYMDIVKSWSWYTSNLDITTTLKQNFEFISLPTFFSYGPGIGNEHPVFCVPTNTAVYFLHKTFSEMMNLQNKPQFQFSQSLKSNGNYWYQKKNYDSAACYYSGAILIAEATDPELEIYYSNRAQCFIQSSMFECAYEDVLQALKLNPNSTKAKQRLALIETELSKLGYVVS